MRARTLAIVPLAVVALVAVFAGLVLGRGKETQTTVPSGIAVSSALEPARPLFGDPVTADLDVFVDPRLVDPASVRIRPRFAPYRSRSAPVVHSAAHGVISLRYRFTLSCLRKTCLPPLRRARLFRFPRALVIARRAEGTLAVVTTRWTPLRVGGRLTADEVAQPTWESRSGPLPPPTYRFAPGKLAAMLDSLAALLALAGVALLAWDVQPVLRRAFARDDLAGLESVERALALLRRALRHGVPTEQRKALDRLSRELRRGGDEDLAGGARRLAWSRPDPASGEVDALTGRVETTRGEAS